jgi:hypothetical protein
VKGQHLVKNSGTSAAVLLPAEDAERPGTEPGDGHLHHVVGHQVGAWVGGVVFQAGAPVADGGAVVGDEAAPSLSLVGVVEVGASCPLHLVDPALAVAASGLASYLFAAVEAWAVEGAGQRLRLRLRLRSVASAALALAFCAQGGQCWPGPTKGCMQLMQ